MHAHPQSVSQNSDRYRHKSRLREYQISQIPIRRRTAACDTPTSYLTYPPIHSSTPLLPPPPTSMSNNAQYSTRLHHPASTTQARLRKESSGSGSGCVSAQARDGGMTSSGSQLIHPTIPKPTVPCSTRSTSPSPYLPYLTCTINTLQI